MNAVVSTNWSGQEALGATYTGVGAKWTVPAITASVPDKYSATWIGIDGTSSTSLIQTGTSQQSVGGVTQYFAWAELLPAGPIEVNAPVHPGDQMQASIVENGVDQWDISIEDTTQSWAFGAVATYSTPGTSAEWIEEAPTVNGSQSTLADFGSAAFTDMEVTASGTPTLDPAYLVNPSGTQILAYPGVFDASTNSFTDYYGAPPPVVTAVSPATGSTGGGTSVTISGDFLLNPQSVAFGTIGASFSAVDGVTINAISPAQAAATVDVTVTTPGGTSALSGTDQFTYAASGSPPSPAQTPASPQHGYWLVGEDGGIFTFGSAQFDGSTGAMRLSRPVVAITPTADDGGYWLAGSDGGVFTFGDAGFYGSIPGLGLLPAGTPGNVRRLNAPVVGMVPSTDGGGYFMVASDGGVFAFGDAVFEGSCPAIGGCSGAGVAVMPDASGNGYWLVTSTGHVYSFGDAIYHGGPGPQDSPVTAAVRTPDGGGYWILLANGEVFSYGDATYYGGLPGGIAGPSNPANAIFATSDGGGYWVGTADGAVYTGGDAPNDGSMAGKHLNAPVIGAVGW